MNKAVLVLQSATFVAAVMTWMLVSVVGEKMGSDVSSVRAMIESDGGMVETSLKIQILKPGIDPGYAAEIAAAVRKASVKHGFDPDLVLAIMREESNFDPKAYSGQRAVGLMQVREFWEDRAGCRLTETGCNVDWGLTTLAMYLDNYGLLELALTAYNRGPVMVENGLTWKLDPSNGYAERVLATYDKVKALVGAGKEDER